MEELLQQVAFAGQLNDVWRTVGVAAQSVLSSINAAVDVTISKVTMLARTIEKITAPVQAFAAGAPGLTDSSKRAMPISSKVEKKESSSTLETVEKVIKTGKDATEMAKMIVDEVPALSKFGKFLDGAKKILDFGEKGIGLGKDVGGLLGEGVGTAVKEGVASAIGGLDLLAIGESIVAATAAVGPVGWAVGGTALALGGAAAWYMSKKGNEKYQYSGDGGLDSFAMNDKQSKEYTKNGAPIPIPEFLKTTGKDLLSPALLQPGVPVVDNTYIKQPIERPKIVDPIAVFKNGIEQGLINLGTSKGKAEFDAFANRITAMTGEDPKTVKYWNDAISKARGTLVKNANKARKEKQQQLIKRYDVQQGEFISSGMTININGPLVDKFSITTRNINESYDKVRQEIINVMLEVFHQTAPAH